MLEKFIMLLPIGYRPVRLNYLNPRVKFWNVGEPLVAQWLMCNCSTYGHSYLNSMFWREHTEVEILTDQIGHTAKQSVTDPRRIEKDFCKNDRNTTMHQAKLPWLNAGVRGEHPDTQLMRSTTQLLVSGVVIYRSQKKPIQKSWVR